MSIQLIASNGRRAFAVKEAVALIAASRSMLYVLIKNGALRTIKLGGRRLIPRDEIEALLAGLVR
jgi:excisionase family DNA binding protein